MRKKVKQLSRSKLLKAGSMSIVGTFLVKAMNLISIPVFSHLMTAAEFGDANIFLTYVTIFTILIGLDFNGTLGKGFLLYKEEKYGFLSTGIFFTGLVLAVFLLIFNLFAGFWCNLLRLSRLNLNLLLLYSYAMYLITTKSSEYTFHFHYRENTILSLSVSGLNLAVSVILMLTVLRHDRLEARILGASVPTILVGIVLFVHFMRRGKVFWKRTYLRHYLTQGIPLIPHNLSHLVLGNADKVMIQNMISASANGIYSLIYNVGLMLSVLIEALNNVFAPWMFRKLDAGDHKSLRTVYSLYAVMFSVVSLAVAAVSPEIVKILAPPEYWDGIRYVLWIIFSTFLIFMYQLYVNIEFYDLKTYLISTGTILAAVINILLNWFFLREYGYGFAAISTAVAYLALVIFHMMITNLILKRRIINNIHVWALIAAVFGMTVLFHLFLDFWLVRWMIALALVTVTGLWIIHSNKTGGMVAKVIQNL